MNQEVEIKVGIKNPKNVLEKLKKLAEYKKTKNQEDIYYSPSFDNYFEQIPADRYLRIRTEHGESSINYSVCHRKDDGSLDYTEENETIIGDSKVMEEILSKLDFVQRVIVRKTRDVFIIDNFEITVDYIENLGWFIEIEARSISETVDKTREDCQKLLEELKIEYFDLHNMGYPDMLATK